MKTAKQHMLESLEAFGKLFQLPRPTPEYLETIQIALRANKWMLSDFNNALNQLTQDESYAETARFGKYPTIYDYIRIKKQTKSAEFYKKLGSYLSGNWWEKETLLQIATPEQRNAITLSGGLENLYKRATSEIATPVYKLLDFVSKNEDESPTEIIDLEHRMDGPQPIKQIISKNQKST